MGPDYIPSSLGLVISICMGENPVQLSSDSSLLLRPLVLKIHLVLLELIKGDLKSALIISCVVWIISQGLGF